MMKHCCNGAASATDPSRTETLRQALRLEALTLAWMTLEALGSIGAALLAGSLLLAAFGIDSVIELISAIVLYRRLRHEAAGRHESEEALEALERRTARFAGWLLYALAAYVVLQAAYGLANHHAAAESPLGIAITLVAALGMPLLAKAKLRLADRLGSAALRADAMESITCGYLSWAVLAGLVADALLGYWWIDGVAALAIVPLLLREAREAVSGECSCH